MGSSVFSIGLSGLNAANLGLTTAGHNIANANTDGYSRQRIIQSAPFPSVSGSGFVGLGVRVDTVSRSYDQFLTKQVQTTQAKTSYYDTYLSHVTQIDNLVADSSAGVSPAIEAYFSSVQNVATNPSNLPARQAMLSSAQTMINRFQSVNQQLTDQNTSLNGEISNAVASINSVAKQIGDINQQIVLNSGTGQVPNDLLDQRDQMVKQLNTLVKATTIEQSDGSINVFIGSGQNLVVGAKTFTLGAVPSPTDPKNVTVTYQQNGNTIYLPESSLGGGELGGLLDYRTNSLNVAQNSLAQVAMGMTTMVNAQQRAGMDLSGNAGQDLFDYTRTNVAGAAVSPPAIGYLSSNSLNTGSGTLNGYISDVSQLTNSDYELGYDGAGYVLTRLSDNQKTSFTAAQAAAGPVSHDGLTFTIGGGWNAGDRFSMQPYQGFINSLSVRITDSREVAAASSMKMTSGSANTGSASLTQPLADAPATTTTTSAVNPALKNPVNIAFTSASNFNVTDTVTGVTTPMTYTAGMTLNVNGWSLTMTGKPASGDTFAIGANTAGTSDGSNALKMASLQTTKILSGKSATFEQSYSQMVAAVGTKTSEVSIMSKAQDSMLTQAETARDSVSGVNLDEEAASLLRYQQAYTAASKLIQIAQKAFEEIANIAG